MKIALGSDHRGYALKNVIARHLEERGFECVDCGAYGPETADYPVYGEKAARLVASGECDLGVLVCGTGCGISLAANRVKGIRCSNCSEPLTASLSRRHNNCSMVALGADIVGEGMAKAIVDAFVDSRFEGGRHARRVGMIEAINRE